MRNLVIQELLAIEQHVGYPIIFCSLESLSNKELLSMFAQFVIEFNLEY